MKKIEHDGIVEQVCGDHIRVKIISESACSSCHARGACIMAGSKEKEIDIYSSGSYKAGDQVKVVGSSTQGMKAVWLAYILPLLLVLAVLIITYAFTGNEGISALLSITVLVPYFFIIRMYEKLFEKTFSFTIKTKNESLS